jgi:hypothetical protein
MSVNAYRVRKQFFIPFTLDIILLFFLIVLSFFTKSIAAEKIILVLIFIPLFYIFLESLSLETTISATGIRIKKFLRKKDLLWDDITNVDTMMLRKKVYLLLTTTKGFYILANSHENFTSMVEDIAEHVDSEKVETNVRGIIEEPIKRLSDIISSWLAAIILIAVIFLKIIF